MSRRCSLMLAATAVGLISSAADARADDRSAAAEKLFTDGRTAMAEGKLAEACPKLAESQRLDPGIGTLLNLAECYERQGRVASAWATYREAETAARRASQVKRAEFAAERAAALAPKLAYLSVAVTDHAPGLEVRRNGEVVGMPAWATLVPVDPGPQRLEATAPGFEIWRQTVEVASGARLKIEIPSLVRTKNPRADGTTAQQDLPEGHGRGQRIAGWGLIAAGAASIGIGTFFGVTARSKNDEANGTECSDLYCNPRGAALIQEARDAATLSTVLFISGGVAAAAGVMLLLTAPTARAARLSVAPGGIRLQGAF